MDSRLSEVDPRSRDWAALSRLCGSYLSEDFPDDYGEDIWRAVHVYTTATPTDELRRASAQARSLLELAGDDDDVADAGLTRLGCAYYAPVDGWTYRGWLAELTRTLTAAADDRTR